MVRVELNDCTGDTNEMGYRVHRNIGMGECINNSRMEWNSSALILIPFLFLVQNH